MRARVQLLRDDGRLLDAGELRPPVEGRLLTHLTPDRRRNVATLQAIDMNLPDNELLPRLYDVRLVSIEGARWHVRGLERSGDAAVMQEWRCDLF